MTIEEFKERLISDGIASVKKHEKRPERVRGGVAGFEACRTLESAWDFEDELERRRKREMDMVSLQTLSAAKRREMSSEGIPVPQGGKAPTIEEYWEYRCATTQIEYVYERMLVMWSQMGLYSGPLSARAVMRATDIVGVKEE